jgi:translation initiation factor IF-3
LPGGPQREVLALKELRTNRKIRIPNVRLVGDGEPQVMPVGTALLRAIEQGLDLVEVDPSSNPPTVRIFDYGRYKYDQQKKERASKKGAKAAELKEIRFSPKIDDGDLAIRIRHTREFLADGHKVLVSVRFRGREQTHPEIAVALLDRMTAGVAEVGQPGRPAYLEGRFYRLLLVPGKT